MCGKVEVHELYCTGFLSIFNKQPLELFLIQAQKHSTTTPLSDSLIEPEYA